VALGTAMRNDVKDALEAVIFVKEEAG